MKETGLVSGGADTAPKSLVWRDAPSKAVWAAVASVADLRALAELCKKVYALRYSSRLPRTHGAAGGVWLQECLGPHWRWVSGPAREGAVRRHHRGCAGPGALAAINSRYRGYGRGADRCVARNCDNVTAATAVTPACRIRPVATSWLPARHSEIIQPCSEGMDCAPGFEASQLPAVLLRQSVSLIGTWMQQVAMIWLVYRLSNSVFLLGLVGFCTQIPVSS